MKITEVKLDSRTQLIVHGREIGTVERRDCDDRNDCLDIQLVVGLNLKLLAAVDISEQLEYSRVFVIEGKPDNLFILFGGEKAYWLSGDGRIQMESALFRRWAEAEYWTTEIIEHNNEVILVYEAGVLVLDDLLQIKLHKPKLLNDFFVAFEGKTLKFVRDHEHEWLMPLTQEAAPNHSQF